MFMAMMRRVFDRMCGIDRADQLQHPDDYISPGGDDPHWQPITEPVRSVPHVRIFYCRSDALDQGAGCHRLPRRLKLCNLEVEVTQHPGAARKINRLMRRGYYQAHR